eukprot:scaffold28069_cov148-Skeletonema_menzelii.AAC.2
MDFDHNLSSTYIYRQIRDRPWEQRNDPIMVGDLPLKRENYFFDAFDSAHADADGDLARLFQYVEHQRAAKCLENLQILLHLKGQEECEIVLDGRCHRNEQTPFHEEIRANWEQFARVVGENNQLEDLVISDIVLPPAPFFADMMAPSLQKSSLLRLDLINCNLTSSEFESVAQLLKKVPALISLGLSRNEISNIADAKVLSAAMAKHKVLSFVDLSKCGLKKNEDILYLLLKGSKKLSGLDLSGNAFGSKSFALIAKFLSSHKSITTLNLGGSTFDDESVTSFHKAIEKNKTLEELSLASTEITLSTKIQRSLVLNDELLHIDLSQNKLLTNATKLITKHLKRNPPLSILTLVGCGLSSKSAQGLCNALKRNNNLAHLDLKYNNFNDRSVPFFVDALRNNSTLLTLQMSGNKITVKKGRKELINSALCDPTSLQTIAESNHTCLVTLNEGKNGNSVTHENDFRNINALESEGQKIRYKVILSLFTLKTIAFNPRDFQHIPLELMPRLLELVQQEMGYGRYGREVWKAPIRAKGSNPRLTRVYERGPGKRKKKAVKKRKHAFAFKEADDEEWTQKSRC